MPWEANGFYECPNSLSKKTRRKTCEMSESLRGRIGISKVTTFPSRKIHCIPCRCKWLARTYAWPVSFLMWESGVFFGSLFFLSVSKTAEWMILFIKHGIAVYRVVYYTHSKQMAQCWKRKCSNVAFHAFLFLKDRDGKDLVTIESCAPAFSNLAWNASHFEWCLSFCARLTRARHFQNFFTRPSECGKRVKIHLTCVCSRFSWFCGIQ